MVKIQDYYVLTDFIVLDMEEEVDPPIILGRPFLNTTRAMIYMRLREIHFQFSVKKGRCYFNSYTMNSSRRAREGVDQLVDKRTEQPRMKGQTIQEGWKDLKILKTRTTKKRRAMGHNNLPQH